jgi:hypothetical protein
MARTHVRALGGQTQGYRNRAVRQLAERFGDRVKSYPDRQPDSLVLVIWGSAGRAEMRERYAVAEYLGLFDEPGSN